LKLACVVHRFGEGIAGGSERHCLEIAQHLAASHDVTVLTTCASDHMTWRNVFPAGLSRLGRLAVRRFPVARRRSMRRFLEISEVAFDAGATPADEEQWFRENGPEAPDLLEHLTEHGAEYDRVVFWSFRYYQTFFGLPIVADRSVLVPTAEEDAAIRLRAVDRLFSLSRGFLFLTPEEARLVADACSQPLAPSRVVGSGLDPVMPAGAASASALDALGIRSGPFALYLGRVDPNKGCDTLVRHFLRYVAESGQSARLVMAGPENMPLPHDASIVRLGQVGPEARDALLAHATVLIVPSPFESLSLVLLEAWNHGVPALVNGRCRVLKGQAVRANGALYYRDFDEFSAGLASLLGDPERGRQLGRQGLAYVEREYRWPQVMQRIEDLLTSA
jgi:glycosyltransferase involved in cell wall biosynthesis